MLPCWDQEWQQIPNEENALREIRNHTNIVNVGIKVESSMGAP